MSLVVVMKPICLKDVGQYKKTFSALCENLKKEGIELVTENSVWTAKIPPRHIKEISADVEEVEEMKGDSIVCVEVFSDDAEKVGKTVESLNKQFSEQDLRNFFIFVEDKKKISFLRRSAKVFLKK